ncbi:hypothetical protein AVEN_260260-1 [Araneus ventricosus]|uniref:Uncharacterized protein n=1 Tax=Araneus ventricosus TaxID=182803 RepID=A0A4Y2FKS4_ARAVE|nr:hypothetical protein AVEN_260260-1 [Araneus ventricosus]
MLRRQNPRPLTGNARVRPISTDSMSDRPSARFGSGASPRDIGGPRETPAACEKTQGAAATIFGCRLRFGRVGEGRQVGRAWEQETHHPFQDPIAEIH